MKKPRFKIYLIVLISNLVALAPISAEITKWTFKSSGVSFDAELVSYNEATNEAVFKNKAGKKAALYISSLIASDVDKIKALKSPSKQINSTASSSNNASAYTAKSLGLHRSWVTGIRKEEGASEELLLILAGKLGVPPSTNLESNEKAFVYPGIRYLEDLKTAVATFFAKNIPLSAKKLIAGPGFPASSIYSYDFKVDFVDGYAEYEAKENNVHFTHVSFLVDSKDQVVGICFLNNNPKSNVYHGTQSPDFKVYNFIDFKRKASSSYTVERTVAYNWSNSKIFINQFGQIRANPLLGEVIIKIEHDLLDGGGLSREHNRLYLPLRFAGIMVHILNQ